LGDILDKRLIRAVLPVVIFITTIVLIYSFLLNGLRLEKTGIWKKILDGKINADILFLGDSRMLVGLNCDAVESVIGNMTCFNMGINGNKVNLQLPYLKTYLQHNAKPKVIVQGLSLSTLVGPREGIYDPQYVLYASDGYAYSMFKIIDPSLWRVRYVPMYNFFVFGEYFLPHAIQGYLDYFGSAINCDRRIKGYMPMYYNWDDTFEQYKKMYPKGRVFEIASDSIRVLKEIIELANSNNIKLILVYLPEYYENYALTLNRGAIFTVFKKLAGQYNVPFWDYSGTAFTENRKYFYNSQHMNAVGATEFSNIFALRLKTYLEAINKRFFNREGG